MRLGEDNAQHELDAAMQDGVSRVFARNAFIVPFDLFSAWTSALCGQSQLTLVDCPPRRGRWAV
jgi:hypothetical protein